jgi:hypothetical protein
MAYGDLEREKYASIEAQVACKDITEREIAKLDVSDEEKNLRTKWCVQVLKKVIK